MKPNWIIEGLIAGVIFLIIILLVDYLSGDYSSEGIWTKSLAYLVAGLGYGYLNDLPIDATAKFAMSMSIIAILHEETINPNLDYEYVHKVMASTEWEEIEYE